MSRWFRFYSGVVGDPKAQMLSPELFKHWVNLLCIAAQNDGELPVLSTTAFTLRLTDAKAAGVLAKLHAAGLLDKTEKSFKPHNWDARQYKHDKTDNTNAERQERYRTKVRNAKSNGVTPVTGKRPDNTELQNAESNSEANASGAEAPLDPSEPERQLFSRGKEILGKSSGGQIAKLLKAAGGNVALARSKIELAATKDNAHEFIAKVITAAGTGPPAKPLTQHQIERQESREILNDLQKFIDDSSGGGRDADLGLLRFDPGDGQKGIHSRIGGDVIDLPASSRRAGN